MTMTKRNETKMLNEKVRKGTAGWIVVHTRATDTVFFGPFSSIDNAIDWMATTGLDLGVRGKIEPLVSPQCDSSVMWHVPSLAVDAVYEEKVNSGGTSS